jgi:hypothetical protein
VSKKTQKQKKVCDGHTWKEQMEYIKNVVDDIDEQTLFDIIEWVALNIIHGIDDAIRQCQDGKGNPAKSGAWTHEQKLNVLARIWMANDKAIKPLIDSKKGRFVLATDAIAKAWGLIKDGEALDFEAIEYKDGRTGVGVSRGIGITRGEFDGLTESEQELIKTLTLNNQSAEA